MHKRSVGDWYGIGLDWAARLALGWTGGIGVSDRHFSLRCLATAIPTGIGVALAEQAADLSPCLRCGWIKAFLLGTEASDGSRSGGANGADGVGGLLGDDEEPSTVIAAAASCMTCDCSFRPCCCCCCCCRFL